MEKRIRTLLWQGLFIVAVVALAMLVESRPVLGNSPTASFPLASTPPPPGNRLFIPSLYRFSGPPIKVQSISMLDSEGNVRSAFLANEALVFKGTGVNHVAAPATSQLSWSIDGPCGVGSVFSGTVSLAQGNWEHLQPGISPDCAGIYTYTMQVTYRKAVETLSAHFVVNPPTVIRATEKPAFDKCALPSVEKMQTWWDRSPYYGVNIYLGGISQACSGYNVDSMWIHQASQQGWQFILTWVGPQAPCSKYLYKMSWDPSRAYQQGRTEAEAAAAKATRLGLLGERVIYYDIESYSNASTSCRAVTVSFLKGWTTRLHELGLKSGAYGTGCTSYASDWMDSSPEPDNVWLASWRRTYYDSKAHVWDVPCVDNTLWADHQRLKQYAGDHVESWGGLAMTIDSNAADGQITILPTTTVGVPANFPGLASLSLPEQEAPQPRDLQLVTPGSGWVLSGEDLLWSQDDGETWKVITPQLTKDSSILAAWFLDARLGWASVLDGPGITILTTRDGGVTWLAPGEAIDISDLPSLPASASMQFIDAQNGWLALKLQSGSAFSLGELFRTRDGGATWDSLSLPAGGHVGFSDLLNGMLAGGIDGTQRFITTDGGQTWNASEQKYDGTTPFLVPEAATPAHSLASQGYLEAGLPDGAMLLSPAGQRVAWVLQVRGQCTGTKTSPDFACSLEQKVLATADGGRTWTDLLLPSR